jgi:hypothetical protein
MPGEYEMNSRTKVLLTLAAALAFVNQVRGETHVFDFATGFDGWQQQWHESSSPGGSDGVVTHLPGLGYLDSASLRFDMGNGFGDDGTLWIEKQFAIPVSVATPVGLGFQLFNDELSEVNTFQVKAVISTQNPNLQPDFTLIGETNTAEGWVPFGHTQTVNSATGQVWVALGIRVAWETPRVYYIDHVTVAIPSGPSGDYNDDGVVDAADYVVWRKTGGSEGEYETWREHFGESTFGGGSISVPEPSIITQFAALFLLTGCRHRIRQ